MVDTIRDNNERIEERVFSQLEEDILTGRLKPRERLVETQLARKMGVSRTPVREAIHRLELKGFVKTIPNIGAIVNDFSTKDLMDIYEIRYNLEELAARLALSNISDEIITRLYEIVKEFEKNVPEKNIRRLIELDDEFHSCLFNASNNFRLSRMIKDLRDLTRVVRHHSWYFPRSLMRSHKMHIEMINALEKRDTSKLKRLVKEHIKYSKNLYRHSLSEE